MEVLLNPPLIRGSEELEVVKVTRVMGVLVTLTTLPPPMEGERRKMGFLAKSRFRPLVVREITLMM